MIFLGKTQEAQPIKGNIDKFNFIKVKNFSSSKDTVNKMKRMATDGRKYLPNKELISRTEVGKL